MYKLDITIPHLPKLVNDIGRKHWAVKAKHKKLWNQYVTFFVGAKVPPKPLEAANVRLIRGSSRCPDMDNLYGSMKPVLDGLVNNGVLLDDKPSVVKTFKCEWEQAPIKKGYVRILVEEVSDGKDKKTSTNQSP